MERIIHYIINNTQPNMTIQQYLRNKGYSSQNITQLKKMPESILLNGKWEYMNQQVQEGDELIVHILEEQSSEKICPIKLPLDIIYEDEDLLVINKPSDMPIHPSLNNYENSLANALAYYYQAQNIPFVFRCINRLDRDTSGLTIVAKHMISAGILSMQVQNRQIHREYRAIVNGLIAPTKGTIDAPIGRKDLSLIERVIDFEQGETAITHYNLVAYKKEHSLLSITLETGRTHQIRVHMKHIGFPLIGDYLYNPDFSLINRQALHSYKLQFVHPMTGEAMEFIAPYPTDMKQILFNQEEI